MNVVTVVCFLNWVKFLTLNADKFHQCCGRKLISMLICIGAENNVYLSLARHTYNTILVVHLVTVFLHCVSTRKSHNVALQIRIQI